jgi:hypothetical protein
LSALATQFSRPATVVYSATESAKRLEAGLWDRGKVVIVKARLLNRGEQFQIEVDGTTYQGQCAWSWSGRTRIYPVYLEAKSIRSVGLFGCAPTRARRSELAYLAKALLEESDPGSKYEVVDITSRAGGFVAPRE